MSEVYRYLPNVVTVLTMVSVALFGAAVGLYRARHEVAEVYFCSPVIGGDCVTLMNNMDAMATLSIFVGGAIMLSAIGILYMRGSDE